MSICGVTGVFTASTGRCDGERYSTDEEGIRKNKNEFSNVSFRPPALALPCLVLLFTAYRSGGTSGSRLGRDQDRYQETNASSSGPGEDNIDNSRSSTVPEDSLPRQNADGPTFGSSKKDPGAVVPARGRGGDTASDRARAKSGRRKSRASIVSGREEGAGRGMMELAPDTGWGGVGGGDQQPGSTKQYQRPKSKTRIRDGGGGDGGEAAGYPSLLDSRMWDGGGGGGGDIGGADGARGGGSPGLGRDIYDFRD